MNILLATDGSAFSEEAAAFLALLDFTEEDKIHIFHVVTAEPYEDDYRQQVLWAIKRIAPRILNSCKERIRHTKATLLEEEGQGVPEEEIARKAADLDVDLIVMGARGVKGITSMFLGSVTRAVAALSDRPLLVTKPCPEGIGSPLKVLFATDGSGAAAATETALGKIPFPKGSELTVLNIAWSALADIPDRYAMEVNDALKTELAKIREKESDRAGRIVDQAKAALSGRFTAVHGIIKGGDPTEAVLKTAHEMQADLIAVGSRGLKGMKGMIGSVSRRLLGRAPCGVLIGKERSP